MAQLLRDVKVAPPAKRVQWSELGQNQETVRFLTLDLSTAIEAMSLPTWTPGAEDHEAIEGQNEIDARYEAGAGVANSLLDSAPA